MGGGVRRKRRRKKRKGEFSEEGRRKKRGGGAGEDGGEFSPSSPTGMSTIATTMSGTGVSTTPRSEATTATTLTGTPSISRRYRPKTAAARVRGAGRSRSTRRSRHPRIGGIAGVGVGVGGRGTGTLTHRSSTSSLSTVSTTTRKLKKEKESQTSSPLSDHLTATERRQQQFDMRRKQKKLQRRIMRQSLPPKTIERLRHPSTIVYDEKLSRVLPIVPTGASRPIDFSRTTGRKPIARPQTAPSRRVISEEEVERRKLREGARSAPNFRASTSRAEHRSSWQTETNASRVEPTKYSLANRDALSTSKRRDVLVPSFGKETGRSDFGKRYLTPFETWDLTYEVKFQKPEKLVSCRFSLGSGRNEKDETVRSIATRTKNIVSMIGSDLTRLNDFERTLAKSEEVLQTREKVVLL